VVNYNQTYNSTSNVIRTACSSLLEDGSTVTYQPTAAIPCETIDAKIKIGSAQAINGQYIQSQELVISNNILHNWANSTGDFGMDYNQTCCGLTTFQQILLDAAPTTTAETNQTFGLDFRNPNSAIASIASGSSSLQLGGVSAQFESSINWLAQPGSNPTNHLFFLEDLSFCGIDLMGNYSNTWQVLVDTGSSCLTLPGEMYDTFAAWYTNTTAVVSVKELPAISFTLTGFPNTPFYIPLGSLVVASNAIQSETGAPFVNNGKKNERICVLRGDDITSSSGSYFSNPPEIAFGALVLQSLYFGADFASGSVGFATKLSASEIAFYANSSHNPSCARPVSCKGQQSFSPGGNSCDNPDCTDYFFMSLDSSSMTCVYGTTSLGFGLFFIVLIVFMEASSFFAAQYTAANVNDSRTASNHTVKIDALTIFIGRMVTSVIDAVVRFCMYVEGTGYFGLFPQHQNNPPVNNPRNPPQNNNNAIPMQQIRQV
jgi:hypothetical protein